MKVIHFIGINRKIRIAGFLSAFLLVVLSSLTILPISFRQDSVEAAGSADSTLSIDITNSTATANLNISSPDGTFASSAESEKASFGVTTNNTSGYTLSITASDDEGTLANGEETLDSITTNLTEEQFNTTTNNGKWGYSPSKYMNGTTVVDNTGNNPVFLSSPTTESTTLDVTDSANNEANTYTIGLGARADYSATVGTYEKSLILTATANPITIGSCDSTKLCVRYDGNGLNNSDINIVNYNSTTTQEEVTKYSHTSNIDDAGTQSGSYPSNQATKDVITIPGASELNVTITYGTENNWDMLYVFQGEYTGTISRNMDQASTGWLYKYMGGNNTTTTVEIDIPGDTATFGFYSDESGQYYGYYAVVTGTSTTYTRSVYSGTYTAPTITSNQRFYGWSTTQITAGTGTPSDAEYLDEAAVMSSLPGNEGDTVTLYAVWEPVKNITFRTTDADSITLNGVTYTDGQTVQMPQGVYDIHGNYAKKYGFKNWNITAGSLENDTYTATKYTVTEDATITLTGQEATTSISSITPSGKTPSANCPNEPVVPQLVYDPRDNEAYYVAELCDGKVWMLDNLRLDLTNSTTLNSLTTSNTNIINEATLTSLKSGNRSAGEQYASAGFITWDSNSTASVYNQAKANAASKDVTVTSYGSGSGKVGVYYNYCAASAGSYCYDYNVAPEGTNATQDICPAGWRMPTNGSSGEHQALYTAYNSNATNFRNALSTPLSGYFYNGSVRDQGSYGYFWSSTRSSGSNMYYLDVYSSGVRPQVSSSRSYGRSVRCLLMSQATYTLNYDKNTTDTVSNMPSSQSATVQNDTITNFTLPTDNIPSRSGYVFAGWGTSSDQAEPTYKYNNGTFTPSEATVYANDNPETLYAIWQAPREITFNIDSNVSSVQILDPSGDVVSTVTTTGTKVNLTEPLTYTIKPTHTINYITDAITKTSGAGTLNGEKFTVGAGTATISITSREAFLYDKVAALSKGKNTDSSSHFSWTEITAPTTTSPATDTSTSGVFEWDGKNGGAGIDSNGGSQKIYFYRGILNSDGSGTYGSDGSANAYPNYVKLANNTCWRIVRTTSTGGVKIIYNGMWNDSTSTCTNITTSAQLTTSPFNNTSATVAGTFYTGLQHQNIHAVGYTYSSLAAGTTAATPISTIFGSTGNDTTTNTNSSIIKQYIEDWYEDNMTAYTSKLEGDAGYCNDRTLNEGTSWTTPLTDSDTIVPYSTSSMTQYYFGSRIRNVGASIFSPTLTCPRGKVDLYSFANNAGNGNGQLTYPVALLTADEASLAGNGWIGTSAYNAKSYLHSGSAFWLLSPSNHGTLGYAYGILVGSDGGLGYSFVYYATGVRPVISLSSGTRIHSGSGTATDPWVVQ